MVLEIVKEVRIVFRGEDRSVEIWKWTNAKFYKLGRPFVSGCEEKEERAVCMLVYLASSAR